MQNVIYHLEGETNLNVKYINSVFINYNCRISNRDRGPYSIFAKHTNKKLFSTMLGFSAGVIIYISFMEMIQQSKEMLIKSFGKTDGYTMCVVFFFVGILIIGVININGLARRHSPYD